MTDAPSQTSILSVASVADILTSAADLYTKIRAHVAKAPVSRPIRLVV
jgi:hypothetical protein